MRTRTLADCARNFGLFAQCRGCSHHSMIDVVAVAKRLGWEASPEELAERLRCTRCGRRPGRVELLLNR